MSSLRCKALCIIIDSFVLRSICLSSFHVHLENDPEYLTRENFQVLVNFFYSIVPMLSLFGSVIPSVFISFNGILQP